MVEQTAVDREAAHAEKVDKDGAYAALHAATVGLLAGKGVVTRDELRRQVELLDAMAYGQTMEGASLVAKAWSDPAFKAALLADAHAAIDQAGLTQTVNARGGIGSTRAGIADLEYMGGVKGAPPQAVAPVGATTLIVVENTPEVHNLVVCTLCSCYPRALLGLPPRFYTSRAYRARAVSEPRAVLSEFGCELPPTTTTVRVHDSTADTRFLVLPMRPEGTEGWSEERLQVLATRDCLVGVAMPTTLPPPGSKWIDKLALVLVANRKQLVARSKGKSACFTPGGKRETGESDIEALVRECKEELSVDLKLESIKPYGVFQAQAHGKPEGTMVRMTCYTADYTGRSRRRTRSRSCAGSARRRRGALDHRQAHPAGP